MAKVVRNMAGDKKCGTHLAIFCVLTHFVGKDYLALHRQLGPSEREKTHLK